MEDVDGDDIFSFDLEGMALIYRILQDRKHTYGSR
jgi:hypothetical protein